MWCVDCLPVADTAFHMFVCPYHQPTNTMFEQACHSRIQHFDDDEDSDEDIWVDKTLSFGKVSSQLIRSG